MKKILFTFLSVLVLAACSEPDNKMQCGDFEVAITINGDAGDTMDAVINGDSIRMQNVVSASGAKYAGVLNDTDVVLWGKGQEWVLILNDGDSIFCE